MRGGKKSEEEQFGRRNDIGDKKVMSLWAPHKKIRSTKTQVTNHENECLEADGEKKRHSIRVPPVDMHLHTLCQKRHIFWWNFSSKRELQFTSLSQSYVTQTCQFAVICSSELVARNVPLPSEGMSLKGFG